MNETTTVKVGEQSIVVRQLGNLEIQKALEAHYIETSVAQIKAIAAAAYPGDHGAQARHVKEQLVALPKGPAMAKAIEAQEFDDAYLARIMRIAIADQAVDIAKTIQAANAVEIGDMIRAIYGVVEKKA